MPNRPIIIAHRGASGFRPEHTFASYSLAIELGADYIEPDLVFSKDGHLICRHENDISSTTNISDIKEFSSRHTTKIIDGQEISGWFTEDFTLAELKTLRCKERLPELRSNNTKFDGKFEIKTFEELLQFRAQKSEEKGRVIGIYPETKHPSYFSSLGFDFQKPMLDLCTKYELNSKEAPIFIQSFETWNLKNFSQACDIKLIQLMTKAGGPWDNQSGPIIEYRYLYEEGLAEVAQYAYGIGPEKTIIIPRNNDSNSLPPTDFIERAHINGLHVHPWTFRSENYFLPKELQIAENGGFKSDDLGNWLEEYFTFFKLGVDGVFSDFSNHAYHAINEYFSK